MFHEAVGIWFLKLKGRSRVGEGANYYGGLYMMMGCEGVPPTTPRKSYLALKDFLKEVHSIGQPSAQTLNLLI